jgi:hypothetical protein
LGSPVPGFEVFAGVRKAADGQALHDAARGCRGRVTPLRLDVTEADLVARAAAALNDALRLELRPWGIDMVLVEPGSIRTAVCGKLEAAAEAAIGRFGEQGRRHYETAYRTMVARAVEHERSGSPPEAVARVVARALTARRPRTRYLVGVTARPLAILAAVLPDRLLDRVRLRIFGLPQGTRMAGPATESAR